MAGRRPQEIKISEYIGKINRELQGEANPQKLREICKDWVGMAKVPFSLDQQILTLYFIYTKVIPNERVTDYLAKTFGKEYQEKYEEAALDLFVKEN